MVSQTQHEWERRKNSGEHQENNNKGKKQNEVTGWSEFYHCLSLSLIPTLLLLGPAALSVSSQDCRLFTHVVLQNPSFVLLIVDSVMAQEQRLPTTTSFSRDSELILT